MNGHDRSTGIDPLLLPFLRSDDEREAQHHLEQLVDYAGPIIKRIARSGPAPDDAFQEATQLVIEQLRARRANPDRHAIGNYVFYVKAVASHVVKGQVRQTHPARRRLVDALRHTLRRERDLASWTGAGGTTVCGLAVWRERPARDAHSDRLMQLLDEPRSFEDAALAGRDARDLDHAELLRRLFTWVGHPIKLDQLTRIVGGLKRIDAEARGGDEDVGPLCEWPDARRRPDEEAEWRQFLARLWREVEKLPPLQRIAYVLNFTAADGQLDLFWLYGVATIRRIGRALALTAEQFARIWRELALSDEERRRACACGSYDEQFALVTQHLPLSDIVIARVLDTDRQKVINLRRAAGDRLSRRLGRSN